MVWKGERKRPYIRALNSSINRDRGRYNLSPVWDNIISEMKSDMCVQAKEAGVGMGGGGLVITVLHNFPKKHHQDVLT